MDACILGKIKERRGAQGNRSRETEKTEIAKAEQEAADTWGTLSIVQCSVGAYERMSVWVYECMNVWVYECMSVWLIYVCTRECEHG